MPPEEAARGLRVLHLPTDTGGNPAGLAGAERSLGTESTVAVFQRSRFAYPADLDLELGERARIRRLLRRSRFFLWAIPRFDVFHFNFGQTFLPPLRGRGFDLPLLRGLGKKLFVTLQGCDARLSSYCGEHFEISCCGLRSGAGLCSPEEDPRKRARTRFLTRHAHRVFCLNPDLLRVVRGGEFVPYASVDPGRIRPREPASKEKLVVLHAPSDRNVKGTRHVLEALRELERRFDVELLLVEGVPHEQALELYARADIVVDQLLVGWYGAFAVEMMALARPVIAYIRQEDLRYIPPDMAEELPIVRAEPSTLKDALVRLLQDPGLRSETGKRSRRFVERWHDPSMIASRLLRIYRDPNRPFWEETESPRSRTHVVGTD